MIKTPIESPVHQVIQVNHIAATGINPASNRLKEPIELAIVHPNMMTKITKRKMRVGESKNSTRPIKRENKTHPTPACSMAPKAINNAGRIVPGAIFS